MRDPEVGKKEELKKERNLTDFLMSLLESLWENVPEIEEFVSTL